MTCLLETMTIVSWDRPVTVTQLRKRWGLPGGHWPRKGMCDLEGPLFTSLPQYARVPFQAKEHKSQFTRPLSRKKIGNFSLYSSHAPLFLNSSSQGPLFRSQKISSQALHFGNPGHWPAPTWKKKKVSTPSFPRGEVLRFLHLFLDAKAWAKKYRLHFHLCSTARLIFSINPQIPRRVRIFPLFFFFFFFFFLFIFFRFPFISCSLLGSQWDRKIEKKYSLKICLIIGYNNRHIRTFYI